MSRLETYIKKWICSRTQNQIRGGFALGGSLLMILLAGGGKITEPVSQKTTEIQIFDWISQPPSSDTSKRDQSYRTDSDLTGLERLEANSAAE